MSSQIVEIDIKLIHPDPRIQNPRGKVAYTKDLVLSVEKHGVLQNVVVYEDGEDGYSLIAGTRRWLSAKAAKLETLQCMVIEPESDIEIATIIGQTNIYDPIPVVIMDKEGNVIAGNCWLAWYMDSLGARRTQIATAIGCKPDVATALVCLYDESVEVKEAVVNGRLDITVYSLIKYKPEELKIFVCETRGKITAKLVREIIANWDSIADKLEDVEVEVEDIVAEVRKEENEKEDEISDAKHLNNALHHLRMVRFVEAETAHLISFLYGELERLNEQ